MNVQNIWMCSECGYRSNQRFENDVCPQCGTTSWQCAECGFIVVAHSAPAVCPECLISAHFINLTCYIPDWGATENDQLLYP